MVARVIYLHSQAPAKPALEAPCNGCGVCCASEPCPLGVVLSLRRTGACRMLRWDALDLRYSCGALGAAGQANTVWQRLRDRWVRRWIAAGQGCDCDWEPRVASSLDPSRTSNPYDPASR